MDKLMHIVFALSIFGILCLLYEELRIASNDWLAKNDVVYPVYPWYVRFDHWLYHEETCRVENLLFEQHRWFGARIKKRGRPVTYLT